MKFGAFIPQGWRMDLVNVSVDQHWPTMLRVAERIERVGYDTVWVYDHFHTVPEPTQEVTYECWTLMAALAAATTRIRLGQMCTCSAYRNPAYMAKVASSVDVISGGRLEFAIGAGWYEHEFLAYGYGFPRPAARIGQLRDTVEIVKRMWTEDEATYEGKYHSVSGAINQPKSLQDPHPPLWIAGGGPQLTLRLVAEHADYSNYAGNIDTFLRKGEILDRHCEDIGRDPSEIGRTVHSIIGVVEKESDLKAFAERAGAQSGRTAEEWLENRQVIAGTAEQVTEVLAEFADAGCVHVIGYFPDAVWGDGIERFAREVIPALG